MDKALSARAKAAGPAHSPLPPSPRGGTADGLRGGARAAYRGAEVRWRPGGCSRLYIPRRGRAASRRGEGSPGALSPRTRRPTPAPRRLSRGAVREPPGVLLRAPPHGPALPARRQLSALPRAAPSAPPGRQHRGARAGLSAGSEGPWLPPRVAPPPPPPAGAFPAPLPAVPRLRSTPRPAALASRPRPPGRTARLRPSRPRAPSPARPPPLPAGPSPSRRPRRLSLPPRSAGVSPLQSPSACRPVSVLLRLSPPRTRSAPRRLGPRPRRRRVPGSRSPSSRRPRRRELPTRRTPPRLRDFRPSSHVTRTRRGGGAATTTPLAPEPPTAHGARPFPSARGSRTPNPLPPARRAGLGAAWPPSCS